MISSTGMTWSLPRGGFERRSLFTDLDLCIASLAISRARSSVIGFLGRIFFRNFFMRDFFVGAVSNSASSRWVSNPSPISFRISSLNCLAASFVDWRNSIFSRCAISIFFLSASSFFHSSDGGAVRSCPICTWTRSSDIGDGALKVIPF